MKLLIGDLPLSDRFFESDTRWDKLKEPSMNKALLLGHIFAVILPLSLYLVFRYLRLFEWSTLKPQVNVYGIGWIVILLVLIIVHEIIHALFFPKSGFSEETSFVLMPKKAIGVAFYMGELPKINLLLSLIAPFLFLTIIPLIYCLYAFHPLLFILGLVNSSFSGCDILNFWIILKNSPKKSIFKNFGYYSYFRAQ